MSSPFPPNSIISHFSILEDPRQDCNKKHKLIDILIITLCAVICGAEDWEEIENFGISKEKWLSDYLELPHGIPSKYTFRRVFILLDMHEFEKAFQSWISTIFIKESKDTISIDGKTIRRSHDKKNGKKAIHMISAWSKKAQISIGQLKTQEKSNEITAIPELLDIIDVSDAIVSIDAMGAQKDIVKKIIEKKGDYVIGLKENQKTIYEQTVKHFEKLDIATLPSHVEEDNLAHGRSDRREYYMIEVPGYMNSKYIWEGLNSIGMVKRESLSNGVLTTDVRYFITSLKESEVSQFAESVRGHWGVENSLHWSLDVTFREDECRKRKGNSAANFAILRRIVLNLLKQEKTLKRSIKGKRNKAGWDNDYLLKVLLVVT